MLIADALRRRQARKFYRGRIAASILHQASRWSSSENGKYSSSLSVIPFTMSAAMRIAINGYGRIGRCFLRALHERGLREQLRVVAINEPADLESIAYLTRFDSTHGKFPGDVKIGDHALVIDGQAIAVSHASTPEEVNWRGTGIDLVVECSGRYTTRAELERFLEAGCPRLLLSQPGRSAQDVDQTIVYGNNQHVLTGSERIVSAASCTTNAIVPVLDCLQRAWGIEHALLTTLHSVMNDQPLIDGYHHTDLRRTRSAMQSMVPVITGLAQGVERLLPELRGRVHAKAIRIPILNVSAIDLVVRLASDATVADVNALLEKAASERADLLAYSDVPHASVDFTHDPHSAIIDAGQTGMADTRLVNLLVWFDNEWGFANRMVDMTCYWRGRIAELR